MLREADAAMERGRGRAGSSTRTCAATPSSACAPSPTCAAPWSAARLKHFPLDVIKIDRSFVVGVGAEEEDTAIVAAIVDIARSLGLQVIAEGVEGEIQLERLRELGCHAAQGYLFSGPPSRPRDVAHTGEGRRGGGVLGGMRAHFAPVACPTCRRPAEIVDSFALGATDGPLRHLKVRCPGGHWYTLPADRVHAYGTTHLDQVAA